MDDRHRPEGNGPAKNHGGTYPSLSPSRWRALQILGEGHPMSAAELAVRMDITEQAVSKHLDHLYRHGFVIPDPSWGLRRPRRWTLTTNGRKAMSLLKDGRERKA